MSFLRCLELAHLAARGGDRLLDRDECGGPPVRAVRWFDEDEAVARGDEADDGHQLVAVLDASDERPGIDHDHERPAAEQRSGRDALGDPAGRRRVAAHAPALEPRGCGGEAVEHGVRGAIEPVAVVAEEVAQVRCRHARFPARVFSAGRCPRPCSL